MSIIVPPTAAFPPNVTNYSPQNLKKWRKALANVKTGTANGRICYVGNSVVLGIGSGTTNSALTSGEIKSKSAPAQLAGLLNAAGVNAHANSLSGTGAGASSNAWPSLTASSGPDTRIVCGSSWTAHSQPTLGGPYIKASTGTNAFSFTPAVNVDTFVIWYAKGNGFGTIGFDINGGTQTTVNCNNGGATTVNSSTITGTLGANTLNIKQTAGGTVYVVAVSAYDSAKPWVDVMNAGWSGGCWGNGAAGGNMDGAGQVLALQAIAPDLTILSGGINDWVLGTSVANYTAALQDMITAGLVSGDVVLMTDNPTKTSGGGSATLAAQQALVNAMYGLAATNNIVLIDLWSRWAGYTSANGLGFVFNDSAGNNYHPNNLGYADVAKAAANILLGV